MTTPPSSSNRPHQPPTYLAAAPVDGSSSSGATPAAATTPTTSTQRPTRPPRSSHHRHPSSPRLTRQQSLRDYYDNDTGSLDGELGIVPSRERRPEEARLERMASGGQGRTRSASATATQQPPRTASKLKPVTSHGSRHAADDEESEKTQAGNEVTPGAAGEAVATAQAIDLEKAASRSATPEGPATDLASSATSHDEEKDPNLVTWDSPDDPENPRNWPKSKRWTVMILVSVFTFMSPLSSSMIAPALPTISAEFGIDSMVASNITLSIFVLAFAIGPLFMGPISELYGRRVVIQGANVFFLCWTVGCALAQNQGELTAFRFLAGLGGSAPLTTGGGTVADLFAPDERGKGMAIYSLAPLLGPAVGPIIGGAIVQGLDGNWRWIFGVAAIAGGVPFILGWFFLSETYAPVLLARKAARLRKETGNEKLHTVFEKQGVRWPQRFKTNFIRPFKLLGTQIIVQVLATYLSCIYGTIYLLLTSIDSVFVEVYGENTFIASLNYISLGLGMTLAGQVGGPLVDRIYRRLKAKNGGVGEPEFRLPLLMASSLFLPCGLIIYGFSAQHKVQWIVPNIGLFFVGLGMMTTFLPLQNYSIDAYTTYAASVLAAVGFCRSLAGFGLPLAAPSLYANLGYDYGNLLLACIALVLGVPAPILLWKYGAYLRARSPYASEASLRKA